MASRPPPKAPPPPAEDWYNRYPYYRASRQFAPSSNFGGGSSYQQTGGYTEPFGGTPQNFLMRPGYSGVYGMIQTTPSQVAQPSYGFAAPIQPAVQPVPFVAQPVVLHAHPFQPAPQMQPPPQYIDVVTTVPAPQEQPRSDFKAAKQPGPTSIAHTTKKIEKLLRGEEYKPVPRAPPAPATWYFAPSYGGPQAYAAPPGMAAAGKHKEKHPKLPPDQLPHRKGFLKPQKHKYYTVSAASGPAGDVTPAKSSHGVPRATTLPPEFTPPHAPPAASSGYA